MPRDGYRDDVRTRKHFEALAGLLESVPVDDNDGWPVVPLGNVLPSARTLIVQAMREFAKTLPEN